MRCARCVSLAQPRQRGRPAQTLSRANAQPGERSAAVGAAPGEEWALQPPGLPNSPLAHPAAAAPPASTPASGAPKTAGRAPRIPTAAHLAPRPACAVQRGRSPHRPAPPPASCAPLARMRKPPTHAAPGERRKHACVASPGRASARCPLLAVHPSLPSPVLRSCPAGYETRLNGPGAASCTQCRPGHFNPFANAAFCLPCPAGAFTNTSGEARCDAPMRVARRLASCSNPPHRCLLPLLVQAACPATQPPAALSPA